ncbi:MAG: hypothetical protein PHP62_02890 [Candidatus Moranbacteria bacterium]|nr:hypothetical protein [Candidatus Moranbacteria bacterium]
MKKTIFVPFLLVCMLLALVPSHSSASTPVVVNSKGESYLFYYDRAFYTSDTGVSIRIYVIPAKGVTLIPTGTKKFGSVYYPTFFAMKVEGKTYSSSVSVIDESIPYILYQIPEDEYRNIAGKSLPITFVVYGSEIETRIRFSPHPDRD